jgi:sugar lactone lactonase YvrE
MSRTSKSVREWFRPGSVERPSIPPMEAGLRPNSRLDDSEVFVEFDGGEPDDIAVDGDGVAVSSGQTVQRLTATGAVKSQLDLGGAVTALVTSRAGDLLAAVEGRGLVRVRTDGSTDLLSGDPCLQRCVTAMAAVADGTFLVTVGSSSHSAADWARAMVERSSSGSIVRVTDGTAELLDSGLPWPAGIAPAGADGFVVSLSFAHRVERRSLQNPRAAVSLCENMAGYPGRLIADEEGGWWVAVPYARNRATEIVLSEPAVATEMVEEIRPDLWLVPCLRTESVYQSPCQVGQIRVLGEIKPWAPARSYGLVFRCDEQGRVLESAHSRADGNCHGATGLGTDRSGRLYAVCRGARKVLVLEEGLAAVSTRA